MNQEPLNTDSADNMDSHKNLCFCFIRVHPLNPSAPRARMCPEIFKEGALLQNRFVME